VIYIHIPFCRSFCTYCDFYSEVASKCRGAEEVRKQEVMFGEFADAMVREIRHRADEISDNTNTLYIGGGTPSVLPLCVFECILSALEEAGHGGPFAEFTVEVNPEDIVEKGEEYVRGLKALGVNRISMGVQSFDDGILKFMNRRHDSATAKKAYSILENAGIGNISIDLIFGLPQLSDGQWEETLREALAISPSGALPKHISAYQLSIEPGSMLARMVEKGVFQEASDELCEHQYAMLCKALGEAGYRHYEISNFALPGSEAVHNSAYWRHVPYAGFGPGAHSFLADRMVRTWNKPALKAYIADPSSVVESESLDDGQLVLERIMLALRTDSGIDSAYIRENCDTDAVSQALGSGNLVLLSDGNLRIPEDRFFISDNIIADIV
jgi:oxygen-independent coproporphyrinogen-3 oxidase